MGSIKKEAPPMKPEGLSSFSDAKGGWWVAHTKSRAEKAFAWDLHQNGINYFLPLIQRTVFSGGRKRNRTVPLFPSYVFFVGSAEDHYTAMKTDRLCQTIQVIDRQQFVKELDQVQRVLDQKVEMDLYPHTAVGKRCRVIAGPLEGIEGTVVRRDDRTRLVLQVSMLGRGASLEIAPDLLEPAE